MFSKSPVQVPSLQRSICMVARSSFLHHAFALRLEPCEESYAYEVSMQQCVRDELQLQGARLGQAGTCT